MMIQIADLFGTAGVSFVVALVNGLIADLILFVGRSRRVGLAPPTTAKQRESVGQAPPYKIGSLQRPSRKVIGCGAVATLLVVAGTVLYGQWRLGQTARYVTDGPTVASLQSNVPISVKRSHQKSVEIFDELMDKSKAAVAHRAELIVWPETMVQGLLDPSLWPYLKDVEQDKAFHQALCAHAKDNAYVLVGAPGADFVRDPSGQPDLASYNSAYLYRPNGTRDPARYDKIHPVLFGEYNPFKRSFPWLFERLKVFFPKGWNADYSLDRGTRYTVFEMPAKAGEPRAAGEGPVPNPQSPLLSSPASLGDGKSSSTSRSLYHFGVIICYEDSIPYVARNFALDAQGRKRIDWLVNISNDGWFVQFNQEPPQVIASTELPQHTAICAFRAVENRLAIVRSVNTGISCLIESTGRIRDGYMAGSDGFPHRTMDRTAMTGWFLDRLPIDKRVTFYSRHGEWFGDGCVVIFATVLFWPLGARLARRKPDKP
jgi:apolipoprotein N-acyltransferase